MDGTSHLRFLAESAEITEKNLFVPRSAGQKAFVPKQEGSFLIPPCPRCALRETEVSIPIKDGIPLQRKEKRHGKEKDMA